jgi:hypothetical protein
LLIAPLCDSPRESLGATGPPSQQILSVVAGRGVITSAIATGVLGFITTILFLFCIPELDTFALNAP